MCIRDRNNTLDAFATSFIKGVLDNPIYCGKLAFGRRKNEKVPGTRNEYRIVKQEEYMLNDGIHEGIISEAVSYTHLDVYKRQIMDWKGNILVLL